MTDSESATTRLANFYREILDELDTENLGIGWWHGYGDVPRMALISEYLVASVTGVRESLLQADFLLKELERNTFADNDWVKRRLKAAAEAGAGPERTLQFLRRDGVDERREMRLRLDRMSFFVTLAQGLDRLAAVVIGVAALNTPIIRADWTLLADKRKYRNAIWEDQPPEGVAAQRALRSAIMGMVDEAGPADWLRWIDKSRNTYAHRAPKLEMRVLTKARRRTPQRIITAAYRQPAWDMTETMVGGPGQSFREIVLPDDPVQLVGDLLRSVTSLVGEVIGECRELWSWRRANPTVLIQPAGQWPRVLAEPLLEFPGYGSDADIDVEGSQARVSPDMATRMAACGVFRPELWDGHRRI